MTETEEILILALDDLRELAENGVPEHRRDRLVETIHLYIARDQNAALGHGIGLLDSIREVRRSASQN